MCGRYSIGNEIQELAKKHHIRMPLGFQPAYNAAPSQHLPVVSNQKSAEFSLCYWGILPFWAKKDGKRLINARAETIAEKPTFRQSFQKRRCLVAADGYYEWMKSPEGKIPYRITRKDVTSFFMAGIWDLDSNEEPAFAIITTRASPSVADIHDRMPVILADEAVNFWLSNTEDDEGLLDILRPYDDKQLRAYRVSKSVNRVGNNEPTLREALEN